MTVQTLASCSDYFVRRDPRVEQHISKETIEKYCGKYAYLPDDQLVLINEVHADGLASVTRIGGDRAYTVAVWSISELRLRLDTDESAPRAS